MESRPILHHRDGKHEFIALDGLRGIAAIAVIIGHAFYLFTPATQTYGSYLAVDLFFMISGFVLAYAYDERFAGGMTTIEFVKKRIVRRYPMYLVGTVASLLSALLSQKSQFGSPTHLGVTAIFAVGFLPSPGHFRSYLYPLNVACWSLFFEIMINIIFAAVWKSLSDKVLICFVVSGALLVGLTAYAHGSLDAGASWNTFLGGAARVFFGFFVGVLIFRRWGIFPFPMLGYLVFMPMLALALWLHVPCAYRPVFDAATAIVFFPIAVWWAVGAPASGIARTVFKVLGGASYPVYVIHLPLLFFFDAIVVRATHHPLSWVAPMTGVIFICVATAAAAAFDHYYDRKIRFYLRRKGFG